MKDNLNLKTAQKILSPVITILLAFIAGGLIAFLSGTDPVEAYTAMWVGAFGSPSAISQTIRYTFPIILLAMSFSVCNLCGFFNIGQCGQMYCAATAICWMQYLFPRLSGLPQIVLMLFVGMLVGAILTTIPAYLKHRFGVNEAMIFLMFDSVAMAITEYMLRYSAIAQPGSAALPKSIVVTAEIPPIIMYIGVGVLVLAYAFMIRNTTLGYHIRMIGKNSRFADFCGVSSKRVLVRAAIIGGAFSGLAAASEILCHYHCLYNNFASGDLAFMGIAAALLASDSPIGIIFASLVLGTMKSGAIRIATRTNISAELILVIIGLIMLFATIRFLQNMGERRRTSQRTRERNNATKEAAA